MPRFETIESQRRKSELATARGNAQRARWAAGEARLMAAVHRFEKRKDVVEHWVEQLTLCSRTATGGTEGTVKRRRFGSQKTLVRALKKARAVALLAGFKKARGRPVAPSPKQEPRARRTQLR